MLCGAVHNFAYDQLQYIPVGGHTLVFLSDVRRRCPKAAQIGSHNAIIWDAVISLMYK
jgi:hypothetical protein